MRDRYTIDLEAFQTLLANALAVQESGMDSPVLAALLEIQRLIATDEFDPDRAMQMIAECARGVANAGGVAIGLLEPNKNELVYRAGSGSAASDVGRRVPAVMSVSTVEEVRREILRVENAGSDPRIEAEICRQFGAMSLIMLPIYHDRRLAGVLQVRFNEAHSFSDREIRAYRLMVSAVEDGIRRPLQGAQTRAAACTVEQTGQDEVQSQSVRENAGAAAVVGDVSSQSISTVVEGYAAAAKASGDLEAKTVRKVASLWNALTGVMARVTGPSWSGRLRRLAAAIAAAVVVSLGLWGAHRSGAPNARVDSSNSAPSDVRLQEPVSPIFANEEPKPVSDELKEPADLGRSFKRVRVGPNEVDYVAEDVTIRYFEIRPAESETRGSGKEVSFGDDVTVRYFAEAPAPGSQPSSTTEGRATVDQSSFQSR